MAKIVMSWSKCKIEIGKTGENDAMATSLANIGVINDKSTTLSTEDGEVLEAKATGGVTVAMASAIVPVSLVSLVIRSPV